MLHFEKEYETPIESNYYQNIDKSINFDQQSITQNMTDHTKQEVKESSRMKNRYQNTSNKIHPPKEKIWTHPLLLGSPKNKAFCNHQSLKLIFNRFRLRSRITYHKRSHLERNTNSTSKNITFKNLKQISHRT